ncbi:MAG: aminoacyl-histidine dipeptidase [Treponema sp.]|nr:aminoacyl-histidine dipeptidase [Treponema sp.]
MLSSYEPKKALGFFEAISRIPRGSGNEQEISDYLVAFAKERGLWVSQDKTLNVVIKKPGTPGLENAPAVILQGHMDMVCEKNAQTMHDFEKEPLKLAVNGDFIIAEGTTLGADNGAAVALALALLDSRDVAHPPLEVLITSSEEVGLLGVRAVDGSLFEGRLLINLDSGEEGYFYACCAGGGIARLHFPLELQAAPAGHVFRRLMVRGLKGGHSGVDVTKGRANANRLLARALQILGAKYGARFADINGGSKDNAIPREAQATICFPGAQADALAQEVRQIDKIFKREYALSDEGVEFFLEAGEAAGAKIFSQGLCERMLRALLMIPNGLEAMNLAMPDLPETSLTMSVVTTSAEEAQITTNLRSSFASKNAMQLEQIKAVAASTGASVTTNDFYSGWEYSPDSPIRKKAMQVYAKMFGKEALERGTHGGLECGILLEKIKGLDVVSFGPDIMDMHTPDEKMSISSFGRTWEFLKEFLVELSR